VDSAATHKLLSTFLRRLTNLSAHNRSLVLLKSSEQFIDLQSLSQFGGENSFSIIETLILEKKKAICPITDARMESANEASRKLKKIHRLDRFIFEERGSKDLHVGWPFVRGKFNDGTIVRCPLLFFPVDLSNENNKWNLGFRVESEIIFNKSFLLAYSYYNQLEADEALLNESFEDVDRDSTAFRTAVYKLLQRSSVELNFNPDNYRDELITFANFAKKEFEETHRSGELKLFPEALLGIFPQAGSTLVPDYVRMLEENSSTGLEEIFSRYKSQSETRSDNFMSQVKEEKVYSIFPSDIWQENALKASKLGYSIVLQGPPGTGKSQLIGNLISDCIATGLRVLLVCQKRAALDVVYSRLKEKSLENFLALVHDFKNDRKEIFGKIGNQINRTDQYKSKNISLDAIQLDRQFLQISKRIDQITEELEEFRTSLFDESECGCSIKELYLKSSSTDPQVSLKQEFSQLRFDTIDHFLRILKQYASYASWCEIDSYELKDRKSFAGFSVGDLPLIKEKIQEVNPFYNKIKGTLSQHLNASPDLEQLQRLSEKLAELEELAKRTSDEETFSFFKKMMPEKSSETNSLWLSNIERMIMDCFTEEGPEVSVPSALLGHFQKALHRSMKARKDLWSWVRWQLFSKDKIMITRALVANQLQSDKNSFKVLERKLDQRLNFEHNLSKLRNKKWLISIPESISRQQMANWFSLQQEATKAKSNFNSIRGLKNLLNPVKLSALEFQTKIKILIEVLNQTLEKVKTWSLYLSENQISKLSKDTLLAGRLTELMNSDFDSLCEFDKLKQNLSATELSILDRLEEKNKSFDAEALQKLFLNSLSLAWIDHVETKHPELRMVSSGRIQRLEDELQEQIEIKQNLSNEILLLRARERVTDDLEFNRLNNRVSYRDLLHQVIKKKKIWPLRKVISEFEHEIFKLIPCWMASPESVSAIFPMKEIFDLVIFDEASQCFAERGIPALYRGKKTVIAGDHKQLRPADFYMARWHGEDVDEPDAEVDSFLELAERYLITLKLNGHYRSQSLELIDFSNKHFYEGNLQLLPDFHRINQCQPAIEFIKVDGVWKNNSNEAEARQIAVLVLQFTTEKPDKEIGIVTFNAAQQGFVLDCLEEKFSATGETLPGKLFVKNIENVQGDERDIIIFSIGYAPDATGKVSAQFGSLNMVGGENRLNVAVSRAREKIIVVSSIWPEQLDVSDTKNLGPKLLKDYLYFTRQVSQGNFKPFIREERKYPFTSQLKGILINTPDSPEMLLKKDAFPFYDLTVQGKKGFKGAVFTDDNFYFESLSAKAPHALLPLLLSKKNWPYRRIYSRNFWIDRKRVNNDLSGFD
jgi:superfamily I DNA and/or RNA helicase